VLCTILAGGMGQAPPMISDLLAAQLPKDTETKSSNRPLFWAPPQVDVPVRSHESSHPCVLTDVLTQAANSPWRNPVLLSDGFVSGII
jgi:hypothetical protein